MNIPNQKSFSRAGFTLAETMVAIGMAAVVGTAAAYLFLNGAILYAKNTSENVAHDQNRIAVNRLVRDVHAAISTPQLGKIVPGNLAANPTAPAGSWTPYGTNVTFWAVAGAGPAPGIAFKKMGSSTNPNGGPFTVRNDPGNKDLIQIDSGTNAPQIGMEIVFPYYPGEDGRKMEGVINKVTSNGANHYNVWVAGGLETRIKTKKDTEVICYYMSHFGYVVEDGKLNYYSTSIPPAGTTWPVTVARNIIEPPTNTVTTVGVGNGSGMVKFTPQSVSINAGESVKWNWRIDGQSVSSTSVPSGAVNFNSGVLNDGATFLWRFNQAGTYSYRSSTSGITGTVTVNAWAGSNQAVKPFSQSTPDYVTINLTTEDNRYSNRQFKAANTLLAGSVPIRAKISDTQ